MLDRGELHISKPRPQLHATALGMQCFEAFRRRYIENEIIPPGVAAIVGSGTDRSVTRNLQSKIETKKLLPLDEVKDAARDGVNEAWDRGVRLEPQEVERGLKIVKGEATDKAVRLATLHAKDKAPEIEPTQVQRKWTLELQGYPVDLVGTLDIQEGTASIRDTKTSGKTPTEDIADKSLQLTAYALAVWKIDGTAPDKVILDYLIDNKTPVARTYESRRGAEHFQAMLRRVETIVRSMEAGIFQPCAPDHWMCSERWCGYATTCAYHVAKPQSFAV